MSVHNHGPNRGRGLDCGEAIVDGDLKGWCLRKLVPAEAVEALAARTWMRANGSPARNWEWLTKHQPFRAQSYRSDARRELEFIAPLLDRKTDTNGDEA